jgi:hypothetical protein
MQCGALVQPGCRRAEFPPPREPPRPAGRGDTTSSKRAPASPAPEASAVTRQTDTTQTTLPEHGNLNLAGHGRRRPGPGPPGPGRRVSLNRAGRAQHPGPAVRVGRPPQPPRWPAAEKEREEGPGPARPGGPVARAARPGPGNRDPPLTSPARPEHGPGGRRHPPQQG